MNHFDRDDGMALTGIVMIALAATMLWGATGFWAVFGLLGIVITLGAVGQMRG